jgi:hypothetical protein
LLCAAWWVSQGDAVPTLLITSRCDERDPERGREHQRLAGVLPFQWQAACGHGARMPFGEPLGRVAGPEDRPRVPAGAAVEDALPPVRQASALLWRGPACLSSKQGVNTRWEPPPKPTRRASTATRAGSLGDPYLAPTALPSSRGNPASARMWR